MQIQRKKDMFHNIGEQYSNSNTNTDILETTSENNTSKSQQDVSNSLTTGWTIDLVRQYINEYRLNIIPAEANTKVPEDTWKQFQNTTLTEEDIKSKFQNIDSENIGIGIICGKISGGLEVIDIDNKLGNSKDIYDNFQKFPQVKEITSKCVIETSQSGGFHFYYRCSSIEGNKKLASIPKDQIPKDVKLDDPNVKTICIIETRGEGGYCICAPSKGYQLIQGSFADIPVITTEERELLLSVARSFNKTFKKPKTKFKIKDSGENKPWLIYDQSKEAISECKELLTKDGWTYLYNKDDQEYWCRPGKLEGVSATFKDNWFYVFTSSASLFEPNTCYFPSAIYTYLKYGNDSDAFRKSTKDFAKRFNINLYSNESIDRRCENYFSHKTFVNEAAIVGDMFFLENIGKDKFFVKMDAFSKEEKDKYFSHIVKHKHIRGLKRIDYLGDISRDDSMYSADLVNGIISVHIKAAGNNIQENDFIEDYLEKTFGEYKQFIKEWLAVYTYTNYAKLPTLVFNGKRGSGKNTFADMVRAIYPTLTDYVKKLEGNFNSFGEKKLMIIGETAANGKVQYQLLKSLSGDDMIQVNKKYVPEYQVQNNLNIILLSNEEIPVTVDRDEIPTDEFNNQFFVYKFQEFQGPIDNKLKDKLVERIGYYVRTELKTVFENINSNGCRYSIQVPITEEEKNLFENNITEIEAQTDNIIEKLEQNFSEVNWPYYDFVNSGHLPTEYFDNRSLSLGVTKVEVIHNLQKRGYLSQEKAGRYIQIKSKRPYCYKLGQVWLSMVDKKVSARETQDSHIDPKQLKIEM